MHITIRDKDDNVICTVSHADVLSVIDRLDDYNDTVKRTNEIVNDKVVYTLECGGEVRISDTVIYMNEGAKVILNL